MSNAGVPTADLVCNTGYGAASAATCRLCTDTTYKGADGSTALVN